MYKICTQETVYSVGWKDMGVVVKVDEQIKNRHWWWLV